MRSEGQKNRQSAAIPITRASRWRMQSALPERMFYSCYRLLDLRGTLLGLARLAACFGNLAMSHFKTSSWSLPGARRI